MVKLYPYSFRPSKSDEKKIKLPAIASSTPYPIKEYEKIKKIKIDNGLENEFNKNSWIGGKIEWIKELKRNWGKDLDYVLIVNIRNLKLIWTKYLQ